MRKEGGPAHRPSAAELSSGKKIEHGASGSKLGAGSWKLGPRARNGFRRAAETDRPAAGGSQRPSPRQLRIGQTAGAMNGLRIANPGLAGSPLPDRPRGPCRTAGNLSGCAELAWAVAERRLKSVRDAFKRRSATRLVGLHRNRGFKPTATIRAPLRGALMRPRAGTLALVAPVSNRSRRRKAAERIILPTHVSGYRGRLPAGPRVETIAAS